MAKSTNNLSFFELGFEKAKGLVLLCKWLVKYFRTIIGLQVHLRHTKEYHLILKHKKTIPIPTCYSLPSLVHNVGNKITTRNTTELLQ